LVVTIELESERVDTPRPSPPVDSFEEFVAATADTMLRTATLLTADRSAAEDLVQAAFTQAFAKWHHVRRAGNPVAYVRTILTRIFLAQHRRKSLVEVPFDPVVDQADDNGARVDDALRISLLDALSALAPLDRTILVLRYFHDLPVAEVARQLALTDGACRTRASRALARLRTQLPDLTD
jgi:RNA polymerase sigma-70 factor (sigma-E family)